MTDIYKWSTTPATNATADSAINMAEFMNPDLVNDGVRQLMARVAEWRRDLGATITTGGSGNAYTLTTSSAIAAYPDGFTVWFTADRSNGGSSTLAINGLAAIPLRAKIGAALPANSMLAGSVYGAVYKTATNEFILLGSNAGLQELAPALMNAQVFGLRVGSPTLSIAPSPDAGFIRLTESTQSVIKADFPELNSVVSGWSYPWGSTATTFNLPPAAGYFPRFAATSSSIDTSGARVAGSTQSDQNKAHTHTVNGTAAGSISVTSSVSNVQQNTVSNFVSTGAGVSAPGTNAGAISSTGTASLSVTGTAASDGGAEVRVKNVALHLDILAKPALVSQDLIGTMGLAYRFSTSTSDADPGASYVAFNNATLASATQIYISETDYWSNSVASVIQSWDDIGTSSRGRLRFVKVGAPGTFAEFIVAGAITDGGTYDKIPVTYLGGAGTFSSADKLHILYSPTGDQGSVGPSGSDGGIRWIWDTTTTMADPGSGKIRLNNATLGSATAFAISALTGESGNPSAAGWISTWDDSTTTARRGTLTLRKSSGTQNFVVLDITSALTDNSTWQTASCAVRSAQGSFSNGDTLLVSFAAAGDKGLDGAGSGTVTGITAGAGLSNNGVGATGGSITVSGTLTAVEAVNAQTGTSYTILSTDHTRLVTLSNTSSVAVTLPQATGSFGAGFYFDIANINVGVVTITPTTSTINGAASLTLNRFLSVRIVSDGTNWQALHGSSLRTQTTTVASASTADIGATPSQRISITGTTTITSFGTVANQLRFVSFTGALTLTHNATTLILPGGANITTAAGDAAVFSSDSSGNWRCLSYQRADGTALSGSGGGSVSPPQGRITLTTGTPVLTSTVSAATTVFYAPYSGRLVPLYSGSSFSMSDIGGELSQATTDSTKSPTACAANSNYDLFVWSDGGTFRCTRGPAWTSDTARGAGAGTTELVRVQGVLLNANNITNGPAAQRGTYVGTIRTNGSSQIDYVVGGASLGGTAASIGLWNMYNRVSGTFNVRDSTSSWTCASTTRRSANTSNNNRISMIRGIDEDGVWAFYSVVADGLSGLYAQTTIGLDSTSTKAADATTGSIGNVSTVEGSLGCAYSGLPGLGWHYLQALEFIGGTGTAVYYGGATNNYAHLSATIRW